VLAALYHRARTGEGQYIDMSQWECAMALLPEGILEYTFNRRELQRLGNSNPEMAPHGIYKCLDRPERIAGNVIDQFVAIACADDIDWGRLANAIGRPELSADARFATLAGRKKNEDELDAIVSEWTSRRHATDVAEMLQRAGVAAAVVADNKYLAEEDLHLKDRDYFIYLDHPEVGKRQHAGVPWKMSRTETTVRSAAPTIGQHNDDVLTGVLGYTREEVAGLRAAGALD
jgi:crotonobetainyl-CoA:carnitine CoA-transferase CaiB-like acyl-CoA transferase